MFKNGSILRTGKVVIARSLIPNFKRSPFLTKSCKRIEASFLSLIILLFYFQVANSQVKINSDLIMRQQQKMIMNKMGYNPPPTQAQIQHYARNQAMYYQLQKSEQQKRNDEVYILIRETNKTNNSSNRTYNGKYRFSNPNSDYYKSSISYYQKAYKELKDMLEGKKPLDLKKAIWLVENSINKGSMSYDRYLKYISYAKSQINKLMENENLNPNSDVAKHYAIQKIYSDTAEGTLKYDFEDIYDIQQGFVTKLFKTGSGQCRSLPLSYLILAKEFNIQANLAFSPKHSYIQFKADEHSYNFETTSGLLTSSSWVAGSGFVRAEAIQRKTYMHPLSDKELIAHLLNDLATNYRLDLGYDSFLNEMINTSLKHYKHLHGYMELSNLRTAEFDKQVWSKGYPDLNQLKADPAMYKKWNDLMNLYNHIDNLGYSKMSNEQYENWLKSVDKEKEKSNQQRLIIRNKSELH